MDGFRYGEGEPPSRPARVRRLVFEDLWATGGEHGAASGVVPLELVEDGDRQAGVFFERPSGPGRHGWGPPASLDPLAGRPAVESVVTGGPVVARVPLPHVRELAAGMTDDETLRNLPNLEWLSVHETVGGGALDAAAIPGSVRWLLCSADTFGTPEAVVERLPALERLGMHGLWNGGSVEPLAALTGLLWLKVDPGKGLQHLGKLEALERLELDLVDGPKLAGLTRLRKLTRLRSLRLTGSGAKGLDGIGDLTALEELVLDRAPVEDLAPLSGHPALRSVRIDHAMRIADLAPLGTLSALRRLEVRLGAVSGDFAVDTLRWLAGVPALEELILTGLDVADRDATPLYGLEKLRRATLAGTFGAGEEELRERIAAEELEVAVRPGMPAGIAVGPLEYRELSDGTWAIFQDATAVIGLDTNFDVEDRVRGAIRDEDLALHDRLTFDSQADALSITAATESDIRRAAEVVAAMSARS